MRALLKANAKENLRGNWGTAILVLLIAHVLLSASSMVVAVGELILLGPLETGVALVFLKLSYREPAEVGDLFQPFQNFVNTFFAGFLSDLHLPVVPALCHPRHRQGSVLFPGLLHHV